MNRCRICDSLIEPFMSFGPMPIANGFLAAEEFSNEYFYKLQVSSCRKCGMFQLIEQPAREKMFHETYAFFSGTSSRMALHFKKFAEEIKAKYLSAENPLVVEVGSNDGIMLQNFAAWKIRHLGVEPSANVAKVATGKGIQTICRFFDEKLAREIVNDYGQTDAFLAANVMCHIPYLHSVVEGIRILLKSDGIVAFEDPYLGDVIEKTSYDQIYDEHVFLFSVSSVNYLFGQYGLELVEIEPQPTHGGSMRYYLSHRGKRPISNKVHAQIEKEKALGLDKPKTYELFRKNCDSSREKLVLLLQKFKNEKKRVVGYAATSKSTTVINYCGITPDLLEFISDTTPIKQGRFSPGKHIPIKPYDEFTKCYPDYALLFAWNHAVEIMDKERGFIDSGGRWILYVPEVKVTA